MKTEKDQPIPDVPVPRENQTGDLKWAEENIYQNPHTLNLLLFIKYEIIVKCLTVM